MSLLLILLTFVFVLISFLSKEPQSGSLNPIISYYEVFIRLILDNKIIFSSIFLGGSLFYYLLKSRKLTFVGAIFKMLETAILSSFAALFILFIVSFLQLNVTALLLNAESKLSGVERDSGVISERLKNPNTKPTVIVGSESDGSIVPAISIAQSGKDSFYASRFLKKFPKYLIIPAKKKGSGALMVGNTLIISRVNSSDFQNISPVLSYLFIKSYFSDKEIERYPKVNLMSKDEYQLFRQKDYSEKKIVLGEIVAEIKTELEEISIKIAQNEQELIQSSEALDQSRSESELQYNECVNEGSYENGEYVKENTKEECRGQLDQSDTELLELKNELDQLEDEIQKNKQTLVTYEEYINYYESQILLTEQSTGFVTFEFASFEPPDQIRIALAGNADHQEIADYFVLLVHEYLHYSTFNENGEGLATSFFTEGLTEYFARKIIKSNLGVQTNIAYPVNVKIIEQFNKRIPDSDLADVYFSNDEEKLEELLDKVYGEGFYSRNQILLETLQHTSDVENLLSIANSIMDEVGGEHLTEADTKTTYSTFE